MYQISRDTYMYFRTLVLWPPAEFHSLFLAPQYFTISHWKTIANQKIDSFYVTAVYIVNVY